MAALALTVGAGVWADASSGRSAGAPDPTLPQKIGQVVPIQDSQTYTGVPKNFRALALSGSRLPPGMSRKGLKKLRVTGSTTLVAANLSAIAGVIGTHHIVDLDLRQESHAVLSGVPVSWYAQFDWINKGTSPALAAAREHALITGLGAGPSSVFVHWTKRDKVSELLLEGTSKKLPTVGARTEGAAVTAAGFGYDRIFATDHLAFSDHQVQQLIDIYRSLPKRTWLAVHCEAGKGRTGFVLTVLDMLKNARKLSLKQIVDRQVFLGSSAKLTVSKDTPPPLVEPTRRRIALMKRFYQYARENPGGQPQTWLHWSRLHP